jgi:prevent-host-death family protein
MKFVIVFPVIKCFYSSSGSLVLETFPIHSCREADNSLEESTSGPTISLDCVILQTGHYDLFGVCEMETINISEAKSKFSEYLSRAASGERFIIMRRARPLAALISAGDLERLERSAEITRRLAQTLGQSPKLLAKIEAGKVHPAMAAFGLWQDEEDLEDLETQIMKNRQRGSSRLRAKL